MTDYLIKDSTLSAAADKFRDYLNLSGKNFSDIVTNATKTVNYIVDDTAVNIIYAEWIDSYNGISDRTEADVIRGWGYGVNNEGIIVPVLYKTEDDIYYSYPDTEEVLYYVGTETIQGETCDKWRRIGPNGLAWDGDEISYYYTTQVVNTISVETLFSPTEFPQRITDVYSTGIAANEADVLAALADAY